MEKVGKRWRFRGNEQLNTSADVTVRGTLAMLSQNISKQDQRPTILLSDGDPGAFPCFRTCPIAEQAVADALHSANFNCYSPFVGILPARRAVAEYLSRDLPYDLSPDDVYITLGCSQAMEVILTVLASPGANILLPRPGFPNYEARCGFCNIRVRHYDLLHQRGWEIDLDAVEALTDENTAAIVIINPGNPCGNVFSYEHLKKVAEKARELGIVVIADEVYEHLTFGSNPFVPMGVFGSIAPIVTLGSISKKWAVPGWLVTNDTDGSLQNSGIAEKIKACLNIGSDPVTFIQGALPQILEKTNKDFFLNYINILKHTSGILYDGLLC